MVGTAHKVLVAAVLVLLSQQSADGQQPVCLSTAAGDTSTPPSVAAGPRALPAPPPEYGLPPVPDGTPFAHGEQDPLLDEPGAPPAGFFVSVEPALTDAHIKNRLTGTLFFPNQADVIYARQPELDWTVAPRFEVGYRLVRGFGEFLASYRFLVTQGQDLVTGSDGASLFKSRLDMNVLDLDYANRECAPGPLWDMRWKIGVRLASVYFDTSASVPPGDPQFIAGATGQRTSADFEGAGPHAGLELSRQLGTCGLAVYTALDAAGLYGHLHEAFEETVAAGNGLSILPPLGRADHRASQGVGVLGAQLGLRWTPSGHENSRFFVGYQFEEWWQVGRDDNTGSFADLFDQGIFFRAEFTF